MIFELGTLSSWVSAGGIVGMFGLAFKYLPKWIEARTASRISDNEFGKELRDELLERLNECEAKHARASKEKDKLRLRVVRLEDGDRRKTVAISLLMNEVSRFDPTSDIISRTRAILELTVRLETPEDDEMNEAIDKLHSEE